ncbi:DUF4390 domain-containing protein [Chitinilyticum litopenaei]|uniref:DUF4390 domain-containing protein n=1 Tax=Chitinilyticum litopenaei TaxID=1121276 RepID=UPI0004165124|nr:DUF4390 domain-containing protein [Chitinilyticum litopenaei]
MLRPPRLRLALCALLLSLAALAGDIQPLKTEAELGNGQVQLTARFAITLSPATEQALQNGSSLPFTFEFQLRKPRLAAWYHQTKNGFGAIASSTHRLSFHPLTRQYRVTTNGIARNFASLEEALLAAGTIGGWTVLSDSSAASDVADFSGKVRLFLDVALMPKPMQISALGNSDWRLDSGWHELQAVALPGAAP